MKYLINSEFVAIRKGAFVKADEKAGEFILAEDSGDYAKATLVEIAQANKIKVNIKSQPHEILELLIKGLSMKTEIAEQNQETETSKVQGIVKTLHEQGKNEEQILIELVKEGFGFKKVAKLYRAAVEALGLAVNTKDLKTSAGEIMAAEEFKPTTFEQVEAMLKKIQEKFPQAESSQINSVIRRYLRANKIEIPTAPKGQRGATGFRKIAFDWMLANKTASVEDFKNWVIKDKEKDAKIAERFAEFFQFAKDFAEVPSASLGSSKKKANAAE